MASVWKGTLSLGLVTVPVKVQVAARPESISFNMLHAKCGEQIKMKRHCPVHGAIEWGDVDSGYEYKDGAFVIVSKQDKESCEPESSRTMEILQTVDMEEVDAVLFESSYYLEPEPPGKMGYKLVLEALRANKQYALARLTMNSREHIVVIRPYGNVLAFHTMFYQAEVRSVPSIGLDGVDIGPQEFELAKKLLDLKAAPFEHAAYKNGYQHSLSELLFAKQQGQVPKIVPKKPSAAPAADLLAALAASMAASSAKGKTSPKRRSA